MFYSSNIRLAMTLVKKFESEYSIYEKRFKDYEKQYGETLIEFLESSKYKFLIVSSRTKSKSSLLKKIDKDIKWWKVIDSIFDIKDLIWTRIIFYVSNDIDRFTKDMYEKKIPWIKLIDNVKLKYSLDWYKWTHLFIRFEWDDSKFDSELQLTTCLRHARSELEHDIVYKSHEKVLVKFPNTHRKFKDKFEDLSVKLNDSQQELEWIYEKSNQVSLMADWPSINELKGIEFDKLDTKAIFQLLKNQLFYLDENKNKIKEIYESIDYNIVEKFIDIYNQAELKNEWTTGFHIFSYWIKNHQTILKTLLDILKYFHSSNVELIAEFVSHVLTHETDFIIGSFFRDNLNSVEYWFDLNNIASLTKSLVSRFEIIDFKYTYQSVSSHALKIMEQKYIHDWEESWHFENVFVNMNADVVSLRNQWIDIIFEWLQSRKINKWDVKALILNVPFQFIQHDAKSFEWVIDKIVEKFIEYSDFIDGEEYQNLFRFLNNIKRNVSWFDVDWYYSKITSSSKFWDYINEFIIDNSTLDIGKINESKYFDLLDQWSLLIDSSLKNWKDFYPSKFYNYVNQLSQIKPKEIMNHLSSRWLLTYSTVIWMLTWFVKKWMTEYVVDFILNDTDNYKYIWLFWEISFLQLDTDNFLRLSSSFIKNWNNDDLTKLVGVITVQTWYHEIGSKELEVYKNEFITLLKHLEGMWMHPHWLNYMFVHWKNLVDLFTSDELHLFKDPLLKSFSLDYEVDGLLSTIFVKNTDLFYQVLEWRLNPHYLKGEYTLLPALWNKLEELLIADKETSFNKLWWLFWKYPRVNSYLQDFIFEVFESKYRIQSMNKSEEEKIPDPSLVSLLSQVSDKEDSLINIYWILRNYNWNSKLYPIWTSIISYHWDSELKNIVKFLDIRSWTWWYYAIKSRQQEMLNILVWVKPIDSNEKTVIDSMIHKLKTEENYTNKSIAKEKFRDKGVF